MAESRTTGAPVVGVLISALLMTAVVTIGSQPAGAQEYLDPPVTAVTPETTSTLPSGGELGNIVPKPNSGREPETPGTRVVPSRWRCSSCCASSSPPWSA
ncbi:MAG: hypothetical protein M5U19_16715 [Microthrixaceae bacterium]|nr:hypothetical protein [Microthrixaceae bacterium]